MTGETAGQVPRITAQELRALKQDAADLVVVDVRKVESFNEHRLPGAISIPKAELDQRYSVLGPEQGVVFY
ncbi:MAG: rhodanese-like domain-containing protein [bacterium]|nr:hypothetical protein [Nitrospinota bacterium]MCZ6660050.1 rhodanese-like domain-containing protein [bacterium]MDV2479525.1 rhodanese-like domain-containing protein [bacterium]